MISALFLITGLAIGLLATRLIYQKKINIFTQQAKQAQQQLINDVPSKTTETGVSEKIWYEEEVNFIFKLAEELSLVMEQGKVVKHIVESVHKFLYVQKTVMLLLDKESEELKIGYAIGAEKDKTENFALKKDSSIAGVVIKGKQPLFIENLDNEYYFKKINKEPYLKKTFVGIPLIFQNEALGVLYVCEKQTEKTFTDRDIVFLINVGRVAAITLQNAQLHQEIQNDYLKTITSLASTIDAKDHYTKWHSENVARYSIAIAKEMKYPVSQIEALRHAALLHDIGKIGIRDSILLKADKLTEEEFQQFKSHPGIGEKIVKSLTFLKDVSLLIRHHHERYDGLGYPDGTKGDKIEWGARILAVADSFDAMTSDRLYRKALPFGMAIKELQLNKNTQFDPSIAECFLKIIDRNPDILQGPET